MATSSKRNSARATTPPPISISWRHCLLGLVAGEALLFVMVIGGLSLANWAFGSSGVTDGGITGMAVLLAVMGGAYLAARSSRRSGMWQGIVVGCGFIVVGAVTQFVGEATIVHNSLASGAHSLVDLGPMNMGGLMSNDLLALAGGTAGGLLARRP